MKEDMKTAGYYREECGAALRPPAPKGPAPRIFVWRGKRGGKRIIALDIRTGGRGHGFGCRVRVFNGSPLIHIAPSPAWLEKGEAVI